MHLVKLHILVLILVVLGSGTPGAQGSVPLWTWDTPSTALLRWVDLSTGAESALSSVDSVAAFFPTLGAGNVAVVDGAQPRVVRNRAYAVVAGRGAAAAPTIHVFSPNTGTVERWPVPADLSAAWVGSFAHITPVPNSGRVAAVVRASPLDDGSPHPHNGTAVLYGPDGSSHGSVAVYDPTDGLALPPFFSASGAYAFTLASSSGGGLGFRMTELDTGASTRLECPVPWARDGSAIFLDGESGYALLAAYDADGAVRYSVCDVASEQEVVSVPAFISSSYDAGPFEAFDSAYLAAGGGYVVAWPFAPSEPSGERSTGDVLVYDVSTGSLGAWFVHSVESQPLLSAEESQYSLVLAQRGQGGVETASLVGAPVDVAREMSTETVLSALADATARALPLGAAARADSLIDVAITAEDPAVRGSALWGVEQTVVASEASLSRPHSDLLRSAVPFLIESYGPPTDEAANVRPIVECTSTATDGDRAVFFGYENLHGSAVRVPVGPRNRLDPSALDGSQATVFALSDTEAGRPGRSAYYPDYAFRIEATIVTWSLGEGESGTEDSPPACEQYLPDWQAIEALPGAVVVTGTADADLRGTAFSVRGAPHGLDGVATGGESVNAVATRTTEAADAVRLAIAPNQADRVTGTGDAPDVVVTRVGFDGAVWADSLASRAEATLEGRSSTTVGSAEAPVVVHAPSGVTLTGGFRGHGVLIVDGVFEMRGDAEWTGLVIVRGTATQEAAPDVVGSARIIGGLVLVGTDAAPASLSLAGRASVLHSPDALALARRAALGQ